MTDGSQAGGAATISGVLYQLLWCVLQSLRIKTTHGVDPAGSSSLLVLEPVAGGGDLRLVGEITVVDQLKAKSDAGAWSLQAVIAGVLPDLFLATQDGKGRFRYRFITEGKMGRWTEVYEFFHRLGLSEPPSNVLSNLDNQRPLRFQTRHSNQAGTAPFFKAETYTEQSLFMLIASELRQRPAIANMELSDPELYARLWRLLGSFEFVGHQSREKVRDEIDRLLLAVVDLKDQIPQIRDRLAQELMRRASAGNAEVTADSLLKALGLTALPLTAWSAIRRRSQDELFRLTAQVGYNSDSDVRKAFSQSITQSWLNSARVLVISGGSGQGKSWTLASVATEAGRDDAPVIWVTATGDASQDLSSAADKFWLDIRGGEATLPLRQIAARIAEVVPSMHRYRLRLCLDNVNEYREAAALIRDNWPSRGVSLAMTCPADVAELLAQAFDDQVQVVPVEDFSWQELHELLEIKLGSAWATIPDDVREPLRRPLLAAIYCDELFAEQWTTTNEYELFAAMWRRLTTGGQTASPLDSVIVESLADAVVRGEPYPWTYPQVVAHGANNESLQRLERSTWLARTTNDRIRVFHDRLLNWAVAHSLYSALCSGRRPVQDIATQVAEINRSGGRVGNVHLGYVPMDLLWLVSGDNSLESDIGARILEALESTFGHQPQVLYHELAVTLGARISRALCARYCNFEGYPWVLTSIAKAIASVSEFDVTEFVRSLLLDDQRQRQRRGLKLLRYVSCPVLLDRIWELHVLGLEQPDLFLTENEQSWHLRDESWRALRRSAVDDPGWIERKLAAADPVRDPVHDLGWLIANLADGSHSWTTCKEALFRKVTTEHCRVLAKCAGLFRDRECITWLQDHVPEKHGLLCSPVALQALSRIGPNLAPASLPRSDLRELQSTTAWAFDEVWHREPAEVDRSILQWAGVTDNPWEIAYLYRNRVKDLPIELFERLLDHLANSLEVELATSDQPPSSHFYRELEILSQAFSPPQLAALQRRRGALLEKSLANYLRKVGPQRGRFTNGLERRPGLTVLRRMNGSGFTDLVNEFMRCDDRFGRHEALEWAIKRPDATTIEIASQMVERDELWETHPLEQNDAMILLAAHERWEAVAKGICRWGLMTQIDLTDERLVPAGNNASWLDEIRQRIQKQASAGHIMAIGFAGSQADVARVQDILERCDPSSEIAHACIIALEMLDDASDRGVRLVSQHLAAARFQHSAKRMLTRAGTQPAWNALWDHLQVEFDHFTALNLMNLSANSQEVVKYVASKLPDQSNTGSWALLRILLRELRPNALKQRLLEDQWLRETLHRQSLAAEGNFWVTGSKTAVIESLSEFDKDAAFDAARRALQAVDGHDRERYPSLLFRIDPEKAVPLLLEQLDVEKAEHVRCSIGRVFREVELKPLLQDHFQSENPKQRAAACLAAAWAKDGADMEDWLRSSLNDRQESVISSAMQALDRLSQRSLCADLTSMAASENDLVRKWLYIDALVEAMDPGNDFDAWPPDLARACEGLSRFVRRSIGNRLKDRRKKHFEELKKIKGDD